MRPPRKENAMLSQEAIEQIRRRRAQLIRLSSVLKRSGYEMFAAVAEQVADDIETLIKALEEK